ncbi:ABC transporter substrate-binding protein [Streptomyces sp. NPDC052496]|uniref:nSTAND3 domain-containing NTPase n=1 Tax=Streptomyces sp. NPDC052496 TaxID=3154951 RepID=UPI003429D7A0
MTERVDSHFGSYVHQAHAPMSTGDGPQFNFYLREAVSRLANRARTPLAIAEDDRRWLYQRFIYPSGFRHARELLRDHSTVLITGQPGSGRRAAALMLLHELSEGANSFHELPDTQDDTADRALDPTLIGKHDRMLLDLSSSDAERYNAVQAELSDFRCVVEARSARLVVVLPQQFDYLRRQELRWLTAEIDRPEGRKLLLRYLRRDGIRPEPADLATPQLTQYMADAAMRDLTELAGLIRRARDSEGVGSSFRHWCDRAMAERADSRRPQVADFIAALTGRRRALALALAMFHGCAPAIVLRAANSLQSLLEHPCDDRPRLDHTDLAAEFKAVEASTDKDGGVRFRSMGFDAAIRTHFWIYLADLHEQYRDWVRDCVTWQDLPQENRTELIRWFAEQCLASGRPQDLWWLAEQWGEQHAGRLLADICQALTEGLNSDAFGRAFRQKIYEWSFWAGIPKDLRQALVLVCSQVMALRHPDQALVRLHHLARGAGPHDRGAFDALLAVARKSRRLFRMLLGRLQPERWPTDAAVLLTMAAEASRTRGLFENPTVRERLTDGWAVVLRHRPHEEWRDPLADWLTAALAAGPHRETLLTVVVEAAARTSGVLARLHTVARDWVPAAPAEEAERRRLFTVLERRIDTAHGIEPTVSSR